MDIPQSPPPQLQKQQTEVKGQGVKANALQKKVSEAIANSLNAINKFKSAKNQAVWVYTND